MRRIKQLQLAVAVLGICPLVARAVDPSTQPVTATVDMIAIDPVDTPSVQTLSPGQAGTEASREKHVDRFALRGARLFNPPTEKEVADAMLFMQTHSPQRYAAIQSLPEGEKKTGIKNFAVRAYQTWLRLELDDTRLFSVVMKRVEIEDRIFGKVSELKKEAPDKQDALKSALRDDVDQLVDIGLKERQLRLDRLTNLVKKEQQKLDEDSADRSQLVDQRIQMILKTDDSRGLVPQATPGVGGTSNKPTGSHGHNAPHSP